MRSFIRLVSLILTCTLACFAQQPSNAADRETRALGKACNTYMQVRDTKELSSKLSPEDSASVGFCMGFFRGFMSASGEVVSLPNDSGHITEFKIIKGTTYVQAIRVFITAVAEKPELLQEDAGVVIMGTLKASGLATYAELSNVYVKKR